MIDTSKMKESYETNYENITKLSDVNVSTTQQFLTIQNEIANTWVDFVSENFAKANDVETPNDVEDFVKVSSKDIEKISTENSQKILDVYKDYTDKVNEIFSQTLKDANKAVKKTASTKRK